jgi:hypothetical protein
MQCVFLLRTGKACYCEVLADRYGDGRQLPSSWVCKNAWEALCTHYQDAVDEEAKPAERVVDEMSGLHPSRIGHFNRIGGYRVIQPHQI